MLDLTAANNHGLDIVASCVGCTSPASLAATLALTAVLALVAWLRERHTIACKP